MGSACGPFTSDYSSDSRHAVSAVGRNMAAGIGRFKTALLRLFNLLCYLFGGCCCWLRLL